MIEFFVYGVFFVLVVVSLVLMVETVLGKEIL